MRHPSPAMVVALVALVVAATGTSYAALRLPANSIGSRQLKRNSVTSPKVKDHSLLARDFAAGQLPQGAQGPKGDPGPSGSPDAPTQILSKLAQVDGSGSGLDADLFDGLDSSSFQRRGSTTACTGTDKVTAIGADGNVACGSDSTAPTGPAGGDLSGTYPSPSVAAGAVDDSKLAALPGGGLSGSTGSTCANFIVFNDEDYLQGGVTHAQCGGASDGGLTVSHDGVYTISAGASWSFNSTGTRKLAVFVVGPGEVAASEGPPATETGHFTQQTATKTLRLPSGATVRAEAIQTGTTGTPPTLNDNANTFLTVQFDSP